MAEDRVVYRGVPMIASWPARIAQAQREPFYRLNGSLVRRVPYGEEQTDWDAANRACHDCRVLRGELHVPGCDVEECPACGGQVFMCECSFDEDDEGRAFEPAERST